MLVAHFHNTKDSLMSVGRICSREVDLAEPQESAHQAAGRMHSRMVGTLVVLDEENRPIGILTDRDLAVRVVAEGRSPTETTVEQVMTPDPHKLSEHAPIEEALGVMRAGRVRRLPVVDHEGALVGLLSLDDVLGLLAEEFRDIGQLLEEESPESLARG